MGAEQTFVDGAEAAVKQWTGDEGADVVIDAAGFASTKRLSVNCTRLGGAAVWIGLGENSMQFDSFDLTLGERSVIGSYATHSGDMQAALDMISSGQVDVTTWSTKFPLSSGVEAFNRMLRAQGTDIKGVLIPG